MRRCRAVTLRVLVYHAVCEELDRLVGVCRGQPEAGGILLGAYRGRDMELTAMTHPGPKDDRQAFSFGRSDPLHQRAHDLAWTASDGTVGYAGEWHTHPLGGPTPSSIDIRTWRSEVKRVGRPMAFAVAAPSGWGLFVVRPRFAWSTRARLKPGLAGRVGTIFS
ncbi:Mov34/MPN/PAD-1 family protein [Roseococcus pinisoli]|uniref:Mov34/MPN/PAD-1 family protein n=1 Tax=Roseococcus pinisoli TaxID=2835040 RepID=UPI0032202344